MQSNYKIFLLLFIFSFLSFPCLAQNYEVIEKFEHKIKFHSFSIIKYDEKQNKLTMYQKYGTEYEVDFNKDAKVTEIPYTDAPKESKEKYTRIEEYNASDKGEEMYVFRQTMKSSVFYFSSQEKLDGETAWKIDLANFPVYKENKNSNYFIKILTDKIIAILIFDTEQFVSHLVVVDIENKKILNFFPLQTNNEDELPVFFDNLLSDGEYLTYQELKQFRLRTLDDIHADKPTTINTVEPEIMIRKLGTDEVLECELDQTNYHTAKTKVILLENGKVQCIGLYSDEHQTGIFVERQYYQQGGFTNSFRIEHNSPYANDIKGIFIQNFEEGKKISDTKIPLTSEILAKAMTKSDGSIDFATLKLPEIRKEGKTIFLTIESTLLVSYPKRQNDKISLCIDENNKITWWDLFHLERFESIILLKQLKENNSKKEEKYTTLAYDTNQIKVYKSTCGNATTKIFEILKKIDGYKFAAIQEVMNKDNDVYALYNKGKKNILVKLKTGEFFKEILD